jgi:predicted site-specific integrase-resolvase
MRSDSPESSGVATRRARLNASREVLARWVSVGSAARRLDVSAVTVARYEAAGLFGEGNSGVLPGGDLRIRAAAVNRFMEGLAARREVDRARASEAARARLGKREVFNG